MPAPDLYPLTASDPPRIGGFWLDARVAAHESGTGFLAHSTTPRADGRSDVILVQLNSGAAEDPAARDRFAGVINDLHIDDVVARGGDGQADGRLGRRFVDESTGAPPAATRASPPPGWRWPPTAPTARCGWPTGCCARSSSPMSPPRAPRAGRITSSPGSSGSHPG